MLRKQHFARFYRGIKSVLLYSIKAKAFDKLNLGYRPVWLRFSGRKIFQFSMGLQRQ